MRIKITFYGLRLMAMLLLWCGAMVTMQAQNNYFSILKGLPHLPVFANTAAVPTTALTPGAMIYSTADATAMIYSGQFWDTFCTLQPALTTGAYPQFTVSGGVPYLPVFKTTDITSTTGQAGALYYPSNASGVRINNSAGWFSPATLAATPTTNAYMMAGKLTGLTGGVAFPVLAADPTVSSTDVGAIYINSTDKTLHVYNGTSWASVACTCPPIATGVFIDGDVVNVTSSTSFNGCYAYYQKSNVAELTSSTILQWYLASDTTAVSSPLANSTSTWTGYTDAIDGKYLKFVVYPKASGLVLGAPAASYWLLLHNCPPVAGAAVLSGVDTTFTATSQALPISYSYYDKENNPEGSSVLAYYTYTDAAATQGKTLLSSGTSTYTYTYSYTDDGKYLQAAVTPKASVGYSTGATVYTPTILIHNCPPQAGGVLLEPADRTFSTLSQVLSVSFSYFDKEGNTEGANVVNWYRADDVAGTTNRILLGTSTSGTTYTYTYTDTDNGKYLLADVTPKATGGNNNSATVTSATVYIWNCPPQVTGVLVNGTLTVGQALTAGYAYYDSEGDPEGTSLFQWYRDNVSTPISGATSSSYTLTSSDTGHTIGVGVTPKASKGNSTGAQGAGFTATTI